MERGLGVKLRDLTLLMASLLLAACGQGAKSPGTEGFTANGSCAAETMYDKVQPPRSRVRFLGFMSGPEGYEYGRFSEMNASVEIFFVEGKAVRFEVEVHGGMFVGKSEGQTPPRVVDGWSVVKVSLSRADAPSDPDPDLQTTAPDSLDVFYRVEGDVVQVRIDSSSPVRAVCVWNGPRGELDP